MMRDPDRRTMTDSDLRALAADLGGAHRVAGGGWSCKCPAHEDKHASLSISLGDENKLLFFCHAGCTQDTVFRALLPRLDAMGVRASPASDRLQRSDLRSIRGGGKPTAKPASGRSMQVIEGGSKSTPLGKIVATYDYVDVTGQLLFQVVRFEPKTFRQRRPKGSGWEWGLGRTAPVLYRLPEIVAADTVYIVEGEKDVERLRQLGLIATTSPMGAGKWRDEFGEALTGKHVVILPDNDEPGHTHAATVAISAHNHGAVSIRCIDLPRLPEKGDPSDWLDQGGTRASLEELVRAAPLWTADSPEGDSGWRARLIQGDQGPQGNEANAMIALRHAPELVGRLRFDAFRTAAQCRSVPWDNRPEWRDWSDTDDTHLAAWLQERDINIPPIRVSSAVEAIASTQEYHPVLDYLESLKWDGQKRIDGWLFEYLGAVTNQERPDDSNAFLQAIGAKFLISAVARVHRPGCKADAALILEGAQGAGKSTAIRMLCGTEWFADEMSDPGSKDAAQDIRGKWIVELAELTALRRSDVERIKSFISRPVDHYRPTYGRRAIDVPRQCVFAGSTNRDDYLRDETGNRRFWPVKVSRIDVKAILRDRDQLWAEATHRYHQGEIWWLSREQEALASVEQAERVEADAWAGLIDAYVDLPNHTFVVIDDVLSYIGIPKDRWGQAEMNRVARHLRSRGFVRRRQGRDAGPKRKWGYSLPGSTDD